MTGKAPEDGVEVEEYAFGAVRYRKVTDRVTGETSFYENGRPVSLGRWNRAVNRHQPMRHKAEHGFAPVRLLERSRRRRVLGLVSPRPGELGADVGCEHGHLTGALATAGSRVVGFDVDPSVLAAAGRRAGEGCLFACADVASLPLRTGALDFCLCAETLEHVDDAAAALRELQRVLKPGGRLVVSVPNERWIQLVKAMLRRLGLGRLLGPLSAGMAMGHLRSFSPAGLRALVPEDLVPVRLFYDKPFFLNIYLVAARR